MFDAPQATDPALTRPTTGGGQAAATVEVRDPTGGVTRVSLHVGVRAVIGRAPDCLVRLEHQMVSRQHAEIVCDPGGPYHVRDLGSRNGTLVNGQPVTDWAIQAADEIAIGPFTLRLLLPPLAAASPPAPPLAAAGAASQAEPVMPRRATLRIADGLATSVTSLRDIEPPRVSATHLTAVQNLFQQLLATPVPEERLRVLCQTLIGTQFHGRWAVAIGMPKPRPAAATVGADEPAPRSDDATARADTHAEEPPQLLAEARSPQGEASVGQYVSRSVLRAVRQRGEAVLASNAGVPVAGRPEPAIEMSMSPAVVQLAAIACPLRETDDAIEVLYVLLPPEYGTGEWLALTSLAAKQYEQAESAWAARKQAEAHAAMERELARAREIQLRLVPKGIAVTGLDTAIRFVPCLWVGGDYVDVVPMPDGRIALAIADVCGKGLGAALVTSSLHSMLRASLTAGMPPLGMMNLLNRYLCESLSPGAFVTMICFAIDPRSGGFECVNGGHPPPLLLPEGGGARQLEMGRNLPLGIEPADLSAETGQVAFGEVLALYTDGLTELADGQGHLLGIDGLSGALWSCRGEADTTAATLADALTRRLDALQGHRMPDDDRTFLLVRRVS